MAEEQLFALALDSMRSGEALSKEQLSALSHLEHGELDAFALTWGTLDPERRRGILGQLSQAEHTTLRHDFSPIYGLALDDPDALVRKAAIESIVEDDSARLLDRLVGLANDDPDGAVKQAALACLGPYALRVELGDIDATQRGRLETCLLAAVRDVDAPAEWRGNALASLGYLDSDAVAAEIRRAFADPDLKQTAVRAMGRTANPGWIPLLRQESRGKGAPLREEVARAAGELADMRATRFVIDMLDDPNMAVRLAAIRSLGQIGGDEAREGLIYALEDKREQIRTAAKAAIEALDAGEDPLAL